MNRMFGWMLAGVMTVMSGSAFAGEVDRREFRQQERIAQGVRMNELSPRQTRRLELREARLRREIRRDRMVNGGALTSRERVRVNRQENRLSRQIRRDKHAGRHI